MKMILYFVQCCASHFSDNKNFYLYTALFAKKATSAQQSDNRRNRPNTTDCVYCVQLFLSRVHRARHFLAWNRTVF